MRTMYDSVTASAIPRSAALVAGYVDGRYKWSAADWARFPSAIKVRIAAFASTNDGVVLDVEPGCSTPASAPGWVQRRRAAGVDPTVYCNTATWPTVRAAFAAAGVPEPHYWIAAYPGNGPNLYPGSVAHQYANPGPYDLSVVADVWPGVDAGPVGGFGSGIGGSGTYTPLPPISTGGTFMAALSDAQQAKMLEVSLKLEQRLQAFDETHDWSKQTTAAVGRLEVIYGAADARNRAGEIDDTHDKVLQIHNGVSGFPALLAATTTTTTVDPAAIAAEIVAHLGTDLAAQVATHLTVTPTP